MYYLTVSSPGQLVVLQEAQGALNSCKRESAINTSHNTCPKSGTASVYQLLKKVQIEQWLFQMHAILQQV